MYIVFAVKMTNFEMKYCHAFCLFIFARIIDFGYSLDPPQ